MVISVNFLIKYFLFYSSISTQSFYCIGIKIVMEYFFHINSLENKLIILYNTTKRESINSY